MRNTLLLFSVPLFFLSCSQRELKDRSDISLIAQKYLQKTKQINWLDSSITNEWESKYLQMKTIYEYTFEDSGKTKSNTPGIATSVIRTVDTIGERGGSFYSDLSMFCSMNNSLFSPEKQLIDSENKHVLAYLSSDQKTQLLTVLNLDEDNRALIADFDFPNLELLLCNYDVYLPPPPLKSLALRPFEARIYKVK